MVGKETSQRSKSNGHSLRELRLVVSSLAHACRERKLNSRGPARSRRLPIYRDANGDEKWKILRKSSRVTRWDEHGRDRAVGATCGREPASDVWTDSVDGKWRSVSRPHQPH